MIKALEGRLAGLVLLQPTALISCGGRDLDPIEPVYQAFLRLDILGTAIDAGSGPVKYALRVDTEFWPHEAQF